MTKSRALTPLKPREPTEDEILDLLFDLDGNVTKVAEMLKQPSQAIRKKIHASARLSEAQAEIMEQGVDAAVDVLFEGLRDGQSFQNRFYAAKEFIRTEAGRRRGFGRDHETAPIEIKSERASGFVLKWIEPDDVRPPRLDDVVEGAAVELKPAEDSSEGQPS